MGRLAAFGTRNAVRFAAWRARREARALEHAPKSRDPVYRGFVQINLIRPK